ncbi:ComEC/Rec2 family competence protein [Aliarcobacter butzleri]|uniref:ComEC/Rec2 family competence protein n=1 Tax=Aliarcobacter butzleri TaxID=28197 RepID=UPI00125EFE8D|nr:ComEC/Rec2 family competence protein [Aliarcobacter butzleri]MCT7593877.1 ComEC/Rec2 family competence protein [Aliarcobacter butzleri]MCT7598811.1 ComEC/Rec2 family competence protein [Aliarcobacter butzleri]MCT7636755.1 ComEC/Rec2 family competence protein [Aliarcobacter butzleri]MCT7652471.1 ComEC/Rec2 family competence protein [Aliarcobacter butzleri]MDK2046778.1 ComEC/Rec2 family competence protein [Aliarcobacter butzleri]
MFIKIIKSKQIVTIFILFFALLINILLEYSKYLEFIDEEVFETKVEVLNIYQKDDFDILKLKTSNFEFFTSIPKNQEIKKFDLLNILIVSRNIDFIDYLKGFYTKTIYFDELQKEQTFKDKIIKNIENNHQDEKIIELFNALFLAVPVSKELRDVITAYGIAHVVALSGFHLVVLSFVIYWILYFPYKLFQDRYFPYRNRKLDILLITIVILFYYLILTDIVPSLLRAFVMFCLGIYLLRSNIKILSYMTLFYTFLIVIAFYPKYIFSIGFWFSIFAVFYIYLFIQYFKNYNKRLLFIFFNIWMFLIFNPIVHYYFPQTSYEQFYSIPITIFFNFFYPAEIFAHIFGFSDYFDEYLKIFIEYKIYVYEVFTPLYFYILYLFVSFLSIWSKKAFILLNLLMIGFNIYLFL